MPKAKTYPEQLSLPIDSLQANGFNTNFVTPDNETKLDASIRRFGVFKPVVVRAIAGFPGRYEIIGGEHRWRSAERLGLESIPVINLGPISDREAREISLADNARYGADDALALSELLKELGTESEIQEFLPFTKTDIDALFSSDIALDGLEIDESFDAKKIEEDVPVSKIAKTHAVLRFKIANEDAERISRMIVKIQEEQGFTAEDQLTNAGDALVYTLFGK